jgi:hypothetical protein
MIDLSRRPAIKNTEHWYTDVNQLYHPTANFPQDSQDIVYVRDVLTETKFVPVLLKEWFYLVKKDGYLVIDYQPNEQCDWKQLEKMFWWLWKKQYKIVFHSAIENTELEHLTKKKLQSFIDYQEHYYQKKLDAQTLVPTPLVTKIVPNTPTGYLRFVCRKTVSTKIPGDSIDKWTFGIVTNGKRSDWIDQIIAAIQAQKIPHYEILICGTYRKRKEITYIPFNERDDRGWITKKKNLMVEKAKYQNICILHDRIVFQPNWFEGMKKWGNTFDHLACVQLYKGKRINDWEMHEKFPGLEFSFVSLMDYRDWDFDNCQGGQLHISKKTFLTESSWNESLLWKDPEDLQLSNDLRDAGHILRCNPDAGFDVFLYNFGELPSVPFDTQHLPDKRIGNPWRIMSRKLYRLVYAQPMLKKIAITISDYLSKYVYPNS